MHMFMITAVGRSFAAGKPRNSGGAAAISSRLVHRPWKMWPAMNIVEFCAEAVITEPITSRVAYRYHHPSLGQQRRELDRQNGADRVGGVRHPGAEC